MTTPRKPPFQFGLKWLFWLTVAAALIAWAVRWPLLWMVGAPLAPLAPFGVFWIFIFWLNRNHRNA